MIVGEPVADVVEVAVQDPSYSHAGCFRDRAGAVWCWGGSNVGLNFVEPQPGPWRVTLPGAAARVVAWGGGHCAILEDRSAWCWRGFYGVATPEKVPVTEVVDLAGGNAHRCVVRRDGTVWCWGQNENGQLGQPPGMGSDAPVKVREVHDAVRIVAGGQRTCVGTANGETWCWGAPVVPVATREALVAAVAPTRIAGLGEIALGWGRMWALDGDGRLATVAFGSTSRVTVTPVDGAPAGATGLAAGGEWACAVASGEVWCAGRGPSPRVVDEAARRRMERSEGRAWRVEGLEGAVGVSVATLHACAVTREGGAGTGDGGGLSCWGNNTLGELGDGTVTSRWERAEPLRKVVRDLVPAPKVGVWGCTTGEAQQRACAVGGMACRLDAPPGYWAAPSSGVDHTGDEEYERRGRELLEARAVPACMCTCDEAYEAAMREWHEAMDREGPLP